MICNFGIEILTGYPIAALNFQCFLFFFVVFFLCIITAARIHSNSLSLSINFEQKVGDKFTNLSKIGFSMERFTDDFLQFFTKKRQKLAFGQAAGYWPSNPSTLGIFFRFPNFLRSSVLSHLATPSATVIFTFW